MSEHLIIRQPKQPESVLVLNGEPLVIGSSPSSHIVVNDPAVLANHVYVSRQPDHWRAVSYDAAKRADRRQPPDPRIAARKRHPLHGRRRRSLNWRAAIPKPRLGGHTVEDSRCWKIPRPPSRNFTKRWSGSNQRWRAWSLANPMWSARFWSRCLPAAIACWWERPDWPRPSWRGRSPALWNSIASASSSPPISCLRTSPARRSWSTIPLRRNVISASSQVRFSPTCCSRTKSTALRRRRRPRCSRRCRNGASRSQDRAIFCPSLSSSSPRKIRSSRREPIRCRKRNSTASCFPSRSSIPARRMRRGSSWRRPRTFRRRSARS